MLQKLSEAEKVPSTDVYVLCHHQDSAKVLFTKVYGELSLRIQQSLRRCNNRGEFKRMPEPERQEAAMSDPKPGLTPDRREKTYATFLDSIEAIDVALTDAN
jgi:hypothetical protein